MARAAPCHSLRFPHSIDRYQDAEKAALSHTQPRRAETRLFPCGVLASFRPSTRRRRFSEVGNAGGAFPFAKTHRREQTAHTKCGMYLLGPSLAAALLDGLSEHPEG